MRFLLLVAMAAGGYLYFFNGPQSSPVQGASAWFSRVLSSPAVTQARQFSAPALDQVQGADQSVRDAVSDKLPVLGDSDCGAPDANGNLKYCFNK